MNAMERVAHSTVFEAVTTYDVEQRTTLTMRDIRKRHLLVVARYHTIDLLEHRHKLVHEGAAFLIHHLTVACHLLLPDIKERGIRLCLHLQQGVTLLQSLVIVGQGINVDSIKLRDDDIHEPSAFLAATRNDGRVGRRRHDKRNQSDVLRESLIFFLVALNMFLHATFHATIDVYLLSLFILIQTFNHEEIAVMRDDLRVYGVKRTLTERQVENSIEKVGLSRTVVPNEAVHLWRQIERCLTNIFKIEYRYFL